VDPLEKAREVLRQYPLCDSCLGRLFAAMGYGVENSERGRAIKTLLHMRLVYDYRNGIDATEDLKALGRVHAPTRRFLASNGIGVEEARCYICGGLLRDVEKYAEGVAKALEQIEFGTFQIGSVVPKDVLEREREIVAKFGIETGESIKHEINRRIGRAVGGLLKRPANKERPDVVATVSLVDGTIKVARNPLLLLGRYIKLSRVVSQGKPVPGALKTVEEVLDPVRSRFGGPALVLHAAGREDFDVRMLGNGRPAVVEIKEPARYRGDLSGLTTDWVILSPLKPGTRNDVREASEVLRRGGDTHGEQGHSYLVPPPVRPGAGQLRHTLRHDHGRARLHHDEPGDTGLQRNIRDGQLPRRRPDSRGPLSPGPGAGPPPARRHEGPAAPAAERKASHA